MLKILITISLAFLLLVSAAVSTAKELSMICHRYVVIKDKITVPTVGYVLADGTLYQDDKKYPCTATKTILKCGLSPTSLKFNEVILKKFEIDLVSGQAKISENFKEEQWDCTPLIANTEELKKIPPTRVLAKEFRFVDKPLVKSNPGFSNDLTASPFRDDRTGKWGFIDKQGKWVIQPQFDDARGFSDGLAAVRMGDYDTGKWGFIDEKGKWLIQPQFDDVRYFSDGVAAVRIGDDKTGKWGFIDRQGKWVIQPQFDGARYFSDGVAAVRIGDDKTGKWGFIDKDRWVIQPQFDDTFGFSDGVAEVRIGGKNFYIRRN